MNITARVLSLALCTAALGVLPGCGDEHAAPKLDGPTATRPGSDAGAKAKPSDGAPTADRPVEAKSVEAKGVEAKGAEAKPSEAKAVEAAVPDGKIGVAECDEYIEKYAACIMEKVPEQARGHMKEAMELSAKAWREAASGPAKDGVAATCKTALEAARQATESLGCDW